MCNDCDDSNITDIPSGPPGPTGPTGPTGATGATGATPVISGTSSTSVAVGTGSKTFVTQASIAWVLGQRLIISNLAGTASMAGPITAYTGTSVTINADTTTGSGTIASWTLSITGPAGPIGPTGSAGDNAHGITTGTSTSLGSNQYSIPMSGTNANWCVATQYIYISTAGYYQVLSKIASTSITVLDLLYAGNVAGNLVSSSGLSVSPAGIRGTIGVTGATGSTGATGPTGPQGPIGSIQIKASLGSTSVGLAGVQWAAIASTNVGDITYYGQLLLESDDAITVTVTPTLNAVAQTASALVITGAAAVAAKSFIVIPLSDLQTNPVPGVVFGFDIQIDDVGQNTDVTGRINYAYQ